MTTVQEAAAVRYGIWVLCPALGAAVVWGLKPAAGWIASQHWAPWQGLFRLISEIPEPWATVGALAIGLLAGLVLALLWAAEMLTVDVAHDRVTLRLSGKRYEYGRNDVESALTDGKHLVLIGANNVELARERSELDRAKLAAAFTGQGYRWRDAHPFADEFRLWVDQTPELPPDVNALFKARKKAIDKSEHEEIAELAREIRKRGVSVRDKKKRQYYR